VRPASRACGYRCVGVSSGDPRGTPVKTE